MQNPTQTVCVSSSVSRTRVSGPRDLHYGTDYPKFHPIVCLVSLFTRFLTQKRKIPPKQSVFHPTFHERAFLAREICTTAPIIQSATLSSHFQKIAVFLAPAPVPPTRTTSGAPDSTQLSTLESSRASIGPPPQVHLL
jgi:hypothetical protein